MKSCTFLSGATNISGPSHYGSVHVCPWSPDSVGKMNLLGSKWTPPNHLKFITSGKQKPRGNYGKETLRSKIKVFCCPGRFQVNPSATSDLKTKMALAPISGDMWPKVDMAVAEPPLGLCCCCLCQSLLQTTGCLPCWYPHSRYIKEPGLPTGWLDGSLAVSGGECYICF